MRWFITAAVALSLVLAAWGLSRERVAWAQAAKSSKSAAAKKPVANTKSLDIKADQIQGAFIREAESLANEYYDAGQLERAKALLEAVLSLSPQQPGVQQKIKKIDETILSSNDVELDVTPDGKWQNTRVTVTQDRPFRISAEGIYRFVVNTNVGAAGFAEKDINTDLIPNLPFGTLVGVILVNNKPGKPFLVGDGREITPRETGPLFLRVNSPQDNKNTSKLKVTLSGYLRGQ